MQRFQVIGGRGNFILRSFQKLLVAAVDQLRDFAADLVSGIGEDLHRPIGIFLNGRRHTIFLDEHAVLRARRFDQVKAVLAQPVHRVFVGPLLDLSCHSSHSFPSP